MNQNITSRYMVVFNQPTNQPTEQPVSNLNANLVSVIVLMEFFFSFNFHIFQQWQRNWLAFCNRTPDKNRFFMIL